MVKYRSLSDDSVLELEARHEGLEASGRWELVEEPSEQPSGKDNKEGSED